MNSPSRPRSPPCFVAPTHAAAQVAQTAGAPHFFTLDGQRWASGAYLVRAEREGFTTGRNVMLQD